ETGEEVTIMRRIENLNASRTLNFTFRQMNQQFHSLLHLTDVRIAFYNGCPGSMKEFALFELGDLVKEYLIPISGAEESQDEDATATNNSTIATQEIEEYLLPEEAEEKLRKFILAEYSQVFDFQSNPIQFLREMTIKGSNNEEFKYLRVIPPTEKEEIINGEKIKVKIGQQKYIIREEAKDESGTIIQSEDFRYVDGIITGRKVLTMKTDGVIVESLLGQVNALDKYALDARREKIREETLENNLKLVNVEKIRTGLDIIKGLIANNQYDKAIEAYERFFGMKESLKTITEILGPQTLDLERKLTNI
ncbi:MAG: hypothetical protein ACFE9T_16215, partial [Promethearchaeota archaeon]